MSMFTAKGAKSKVRRMAGTGLALALAISVLSGCSGSKASDNEQKVLRIGMLYGGYDDTYFRQQYTDAFELTHPNVDIEIVPAIDQSIYRYNDGTEPIEQPDTLESMKKIMTGSNPVDVVVTDTSTLKQLVQENMLKQLDPLMQEDKFDTSDFVPTVIDGLKDIGEGNLYALAPTFSSSALFYNKEIFKNAGVEPPQDGMTWDQVFELARRVSKGEGKNRVYGMAFNTYMGSDPYWDMQNYTSALQLRYFDDQAQTMTVDTPQWEKVWSTMSKLYMDKIVPDGSQMINDASEMSSSPVGQDMFLSGKVAMVIGYNSYVNDVVDANNNASKIKNFKAVDWDVATMPTHPEKPGIGGNSYLSSAFAINSSAPNAETAWEFVKFQNSEEWAKIKSRSSYEMVARKSYIKPKDGKDYNIQAFYALKPVPPTSNTDDKLYTEKPGLSSVTSIGQQYFKEVLDNKKTPAEALKEWQQKGNTMLQAIKNNPKTMFQEDGTPYVPQDSGASTGVKD
ncbi:ABC transporter substrate-binding protein [Paenibacillus pinistramenti]|uniref:ABC transporter substrate-binding protein n=1 Tax=Paenibacillus pinistramenti TaxID=1768003 RepID=UPI001EF148DD|nr:extracellular solute-binding protein [Paenibacillus pinistramenti]